MRVAAATPSISESCQTTHNRRERANMSLVERVVSVAVGVLLLSPASARATTGAIWLSGAEIQSYALEASSSSANALIDTTTKRSGAAAFALRSGANGIGQFFSPVWSSPVSNGPVYI